MNNNNILIEYISVLFHTSNTFEIVICLENISAHYCTSDIASPSSELLIITVEKIIHDKPHKDFSQDN